MESQFLYSTNIKLLIFNKCRMTMRTLDEGSTNNFVFFLLKQRFNYLRPRLLKSYLLVQ